MTYLYRSFLTPIQFNDPLLLARAWPSRSRSCTVLAPSADVVAATSREDGALLGSRRARRLRGVLLDEARSVGLQRTMSDFSVIATDLLPAHAWNVLPKTGLW